MVLPTPKEKEEPEGSSEVKRVETLVFAFNTNDGGFPAPTPSPIGWVRTQHNLWPTEWKTQNMPLSALDANCDIPLMLFLYLNLITNNDQKRHDNARSPLSFGSK